MKIYIERHPNNAGHWIYKGYEAAWNSEGYEVEFYEEIESIKAPAEYEIMADDSGIRTTKSLDAIQHAKKAYVYVQPNKYPMHWGQHPNFVSQMSWDIGSSSIV